MGKLNGFKQYARELSARRSVEERVKTYREFVKDFPEEKLKEQAARCMDCGIPFCHSGCPLGNVIPDFNDLIYRGLWRKAYLRLHDTNNFPEFTGRICPAPCEYACVAGISYEPVTIEQIELNIVEHAFEHGWVEPRQNSIKTGKKICVIGSGPSGLAVAAQLNSAGHEVTVMEKAPKVGGLLRYGIPDFKLEKWVIDRRINILKKEGISFLTNTDVGGNFPVSDLKKYDAVILAIGSTVPRDLPAPGRELDGVHFAMEYLVSQNKMNDGLDGNDTIDVQGKDVIVIGGGDTGSDCVGTAHRQKANSVTNFELFPKPSKERPQSQPWPYYPNVLKVSTSHEEGGDRDWSILTKEFLGSNGKLEKIKTIKVEWEFPSGERPKMKEIPGTERVWKADYVFLAMGFTGPRPDGLLKELGIELDQSGNIKTDEKYMTNVPGIFAAGDSRRGQSLVVWAISEGRETAFAVDKYLMGHSNLPKKGKGDIPRV